MIVAWVYLKRSSVSAPLQKSSGKSIKCAPQNRPSPVRVPVLHSGQEVLPAGPTRPSSSADSVRPPYTFNHPNADSENLAKAKGKGKTVGEVTGIPEMTVLADSPSQHIVMPLIIQYSEGGKRYHLPGQCNHLCAAKKPMHTLEVCKDCVRAVSRETAATVGILDFNK